MTVTANPVGDGFAASLARPGGTFTGVSAAMADLSSKHIELLKAVLPKLSRVAVLSHPGNPGHPPQVKDVEVAARGLGVRVIEVLAANDAEIARGFSSMSAEGVQAAIILPDTFYVQQARQITGLAIKHRIASIYGAREYVEVGGLMTYGPDFRDSFRRAARYVDSIFKGAKPADLPIEQPSRVELTVNLRTAKTLDMAIPHSVLVRADKVIE
jgi:putative ABC transport system substrate-binding protein